MTSLVLKGMAARKLRTALTAVAIVLGAAMVTGTLIVGHTVKGGFHEWYTQAQRQVRCRHQRTPHRPRLQLRRRHADTPALVLARPAGAGTCPAWLVLKASCRGTRS